MACESVNMKNETDCLTGVVLRQKADLHLVLPAVLRLHIPMCLCTEHRCYAGVPLLRWACGIGFLGEYRSKASTNCILHG